ncbi:uncharacterized protein LOC111679909 [Lucilia cuprina]|uniref:uncharacterized protein LOC111679909 n=1 Tax=Lucilia cuprina TaxID=7375 RepID=UPI001F0690BC|nr:uncharacterized protein LOC111679909 [Lucilia cuprina]
MPNKKNPRIRNRARNKANRLKLLENQENQENLNNEQTVTNIQEQEHFKLPKSELNEPSLHEEAEDDEDDDMPELMDDNNVAFNKTPQQEQDPLKTLQNLMQSKFMQKQSKTSEAKETKNKATEVKTNDKDLKEKSLKNANVKAGKTKEKLNENESASEKNAFIQNLQKKMEQMMANGDENLPNTLMENLKKMFDQGPVTDIESSDDEEEYIEYIYKPRKYFLVALCNLCKTDLCKLSQLIECSKCHMTFYCSMEHMHNDAEHQQLCYALQQVAAETCHGHIFKNCSTMPADHFRSYRIITIRKVESILERHLNATEQEVILFPRLCNNVKCREYQYEKLHDCSECGMIAYCLEHPEHMNPEDHAKWCKSYQLFKELVQFQEKFGRLDPALPTKILKELPISCLNTKEIFNKLGCDLPVNSEYASLSQISTGPLTAWYALKLADQLKNHESLTIHLIGAEIEFEVDVLHKWELFFLHITPCVKSLNIVFVGPELNPNNISFDQLQKTKCCTACRKSQRNVRYFFESYIYHDYCRSDKFLKPNLICFFNAGLYRSTGYNMEDTWPETILAAANLQVPIVVTAYTEYESPLDMQRFAEECQRKLRLIQAPSQNPFASVKPERNFISDDEAPLMFKNYYCFVVE